MEVILTGRVTTWSKFKTTYQIDVDKIEIAGEGALLKIIEERKKRLKEKAFDKRSFEEDALELKKFIEVSKEALELKKIIEVSTENVPKEFNNFQQELLESQKTSNEILVEKTLKSIEEQLSGETGFEKIEIERLQNEIKENLSIIFD